MSYLPTKNDFLPQQDFVMIEGQELEGPGERRARSNDAALGGHGNFHPGQQTAITDDNYIATNISSDVNLYRHCQAIDFDALFAMSLGDTLCKPVFNLGKMTKEGRDRSCRLCDLLWYSGPNDSYRKDDYWLSLVSWADIERQGPGGPVGPFSSLDGCGLVVLYSKPSWRDESWQLLMRHMWHNRLDEYLGWPSKECSGSSKFHLRRVSPSRIDFSVIKGWLKDCQCSHEQFCMPSNRPFADYFRLIQCKSRRIVTISESTYPIPQFLALSYVWGNNAEKEQGTPSRDHLPEGCPLTIEDSITVMMELGFEYLWIDRYCIWQDDDEDKHIQLQLMSRIYGSAQATIVAAAGSDPNYGLPVSNRHRIPQPEIQIGSHTLCWTMGNCKSVVEKSVWMTRAWTFQEALLSRLKIMFTDWQVYFDCEIMSRSEAKNEPSPTFSSSEYLLKWRKSWARPAFLLPFPKICIQPSHNVSDMIMPYTQRHIGK